MLRLHTLPEGLDFAAVETSEMDGICDAAMKDDPVPS
jgi:hypothetical protein